MHSLLSYVGRYAYLYYVVKIYYVRLEGISQQLLCTRGPEGANYSFVPCNLPNVSYSLLKVRTSQQSSGWHPRQQYPRHLPRLLQ